jgi:DNA repair protein RadD
MIEPRNYQANCVNRIWKSWKSAKDNDVLVKLPTASGKTIIFTLLLEKLFKAQGSAKAIVLVNRVQLIGQTVEKLNLLFTQDQLGICCGSLGEYDADSPVVVASIDTIKNQTPQATVLIIDEAHNAYESSKYNSLLIRMLKANPKLRVARFTATDFTSSHGYIWGKGKPIEKILYKKSMKEMIALGYILPPIFKASKEAFDLTDVRKKRNEFIMKDLLHLTADQKKMKKQVKDALSKTKDRKKVVWCCTSIKHAEAVHEEISKTEVASIIHSKLNRSEQQMNVEEFEEGSVRHIVSVTMVSEGYDYPPIDAIVCLRPTRSPVLYVQLIGRGLRLSIGKENCLFLDYGSIVENLGHPNKPFVKEGRKKDNQVRALICPICETVSFLPAKICSSPDCNYEFYVESYKKRRTKLTNNQTASSSDPTFSQNLYPILELGVLDWKIDQNYMTKTKKIMIEVRYKTMLKTVYQYIQKDRLSTRSLRQDLKAYNGKAPKKIKVERQGKWDKVLERIF